MYGKLNPFLKSPGEIDFDLEAKLRVINSDLGKNQLKNYHFQNNEFEISLMEDNDTNYNDSPNENERIFSPKQNKR